MLICRTVFVFSSSLVPMHSLPEHPEMVRLRFVRSADYSSQRQKLRHDADEGIGRVRGWSVRGAFLKRSREPHQ